MHCCLLVIGWTVRGALKMIQQIRFNPFIKFSDVHRKLLAFSSSCATVRVIFHSKEEIITKTKKKRVNIQPLDLTRLPS